jgi:hypothetical protein
MGTSQVEQVTPPSVTGLVGKAFGVPPRDDGDCADDVIAFSQVNASLQNPVTTSLNGV